MGHHPFCGENMILRQMVSIIYTVKRSIKTALGTNKMYLYTDGHYMQVQYMESIPLRTCKMCSL